MCLYLASHRSSRTTTLMDYGNASRAYIVVSMRNAMLLHWRWGYITDAPLFLPDRNVPSKIYTQVQCIIPCCANGLRCLLPHLSDNRNVVMVSMISTDRVRPPNRSTPTATETTSIQAEVLPQCREFAPTPCCIPCILYILCGTIG